METKVTCLPEQKPRIYVKVQEISTVYRRYGKVIRGGKRSTDGDNSAFNGLYWIAWRLGVCNHPCDYMR